MPGPGPISQLAADVPGDCYAEFSARTLERTRTNKVYYRCTFRDRHAALVAKVWEEQPQFTACERDWHVGTVYKLRTLLTRHPQYGPQLEILQIRPVSEADRARGYDPADYERPPAFDAEAGFDALIEFLTREIVDAATCELAVGLLAAHRETLVRLPATQRHFYPAPGGWVRHTASVTRTCAWLADHYLDHFGDVRHPINRDLVIAGAALHDTGRAVEFQLPDDDGAVGLTLAGQLHGHLILGRDLVLEFAQSVKNLAPERLLLLEHLILSHLNSPAWGSPRLPVAPEAMILHHADDLDAKLELFHRAIEDDPTPGDWTARDPVLGKPLWKTRPGPTPPPPP